MAEEKKSDHAPDAPNSANSDSDDIVMGDGRALAPLVAAMLLNPPRIFEPSEETIRVLIKFPEEEDSKTGMLVVTPVGASIDYVLEAVQPRIEHRFGRDATVTLHDTSGELARLERVTRSGLPLQTTNLPDSIRLDGIIHRRPPVAPPAAAAMSPEERSQVLQDIYRLTTTPLLPESSSEDKNETVAKKPRGRPRKGMEWVEGKGWIPDRSGDNQTTEARAIVKVSGILEKFEVKRIRDGGKNEIALRLKINNLINSWYGVQVKSCDCRSFSSSHSRGRASFNQVNTYPNSIVMCVLLNPLTIWLRHGRDLAEKGATLRESHLPESTNALCYQEDEEGSILLNKLEERLELMFDDKAYAYERRPMNTFEVEKLAKSLWEGVQPLTKEFYELVKAGTDKTVQDAIETSRKLIDIKRDVREAEDKKAAVIMKASRAAWAKVVVCERADATIRYIQLRPKEGVPPEDRTFGFDYSRTSDGLVVTRVVLEGASANCGLRHGDVIINIQGKHFEDLENDKIDTLIKDCLNVNGDLGLRIVRCPPGAMMPAAPALTTPAPTPAPTTPDPIPADTPQGLAACFAAFYPGSPAEAKAKFQQFVLDNTLCPSHVLNMPVAKCESMLQQQGFESVVVFTFQSRLREVCLPAAAPTTPAAPAPPHIAALPAAPPPPHASWPLRYPRVKPDKRPKKCDKRILEKWQDLPMPDAKAMELAAIPATSRLPAPMTDSEGETTVCERPLQWRLGPNVQPSPADMLKVLNLGVPLIYTMNHTGVALASQTLGCTAVPDEFMDYCALQRLLLIRAAPQSLPSHKNLPCLLVSYSLTY